MTGEHVTNDFENRLADVRRRHRRQRQTDIVDSDCHTHSRLELREEWIAAKRVIEGVTNGGFTIGQTFDRRVRVENARSDRYVLENEVFPGRHDARRAVAIDVDYGFVRLSSELKCHMFDCQLPIADCRFLRS